LSTWELRNRPLKNLDFVITFLWTSVAKAVIELIHAQNNIAFIIVAPVTLFVCKLAKVAVLAICDFAKF